MLCRTAAVSETSRRKYLRVMHRSERSVSCSCAGRYSRSSPSQAQSHSLPDPIRQRILVQKQPAPRTFVILTPVLHAMNRRHRTLRLEMHPFVTSHSFIRQPIQRRLKTRRHRIALLKGKPQPIQPKRKFHSIQLIRHPQPRYRVIKRFAIRANNCLHKKIQPTIRLARNLRPVSAFAAFKPIRSAHAY
jgi:hypothetical protein